GAGDFTIRNGLLELKPTAFQLLQSDVDAAGLKLSNFARTLARVQQTGVNQVDPVTKKERDAGAPPFRNAGLMLVHSERASALDKNTKEIVHEDPVSDAEPEVPPGLHLQTVFQATPGSLPRLRYGRKYRIRARIVDLAGNSLALRPKDFGLEDSEKNAPTYFR